MEGDWMMRKEDIQGLTPEQIQQKFSLSVAPNRIVDVKVPVGTELRAGTAAPVNTSNLTTEGGGTQFEVIKSNLPSESYSKPRKLK